MSSSRLTALVEALAGLRAEPLTDETGRNLEGWILDCLRRARRSEGPIPVLPTADGRSRVWYRDRTSSPEGAAFANAYSLGSETTPPPLHWILVPAVLATAEDRNASGRELLLSLRVGWLTAKAFEWGMGSGIRPRGLDPVTLCGCLGAAAACTHLRDPEPDRLTRSIALAGMQVPLPLAEPGDSSSWERKLLSAWPAFVGAHVAGLVERGFEGPRDLFEKEEDGLRVLLPLVNELEAKTNAPKGRPPAATEVSASTREAVAALAEAKTLQRLMETLTPEGRSRRRGERARIGRNSGASLAPSRTSLAGEIVRWTASLTPAQVPADARHAARRVLMDQIGISFAGWRHPRNRKLFEWASRSPGHPGGRLWPGGESSFLPYAVLANRIAADDLELTAGPECGLAAWAIAEHAGRTLGELLTAIVVASEVEASYRRLHLLEIERDGLHPPARLGILGATAAGAYLLRLEQDASIRALALAGCLAPASPYAAFSTGATGKRLYGAWSQMVGSWLGLMVETMVPGPLPLQDGGLDSFEPLWAVRQVSFKAFPCSRACHPALTALETLSKAERPTWKSINNVEVTSYPFSVHLDRRTRGNTPIAAQMSLKQTLALALVVGTLDYSEASLRDPRVRHLASRITVRPAEGLEEGPQRKRWARLRIRLEDGTERVAESEARWSLSAPATDSELRARFLEWTENRSPIDPWTASESQSIAEMANEGLDD